MLRTSNVFAHQIIRVVGSPPVFSSLQRPMMIVSKRLVPCAPCAKSVSFVTLLLKLPALQASGEESDFWPIALPTLFVDQLKSSIVAQFGHVNAKVRAL
eukprot:scaffold36803_cov45-Cyclotella_meneghiniana.AAC.1